MGGWTRGERGKRKYRAQGMPDKRDVLEAIKKIEPYEKMIQGLFGPILHLEGIIFEAPQHASKPSNIGIEGIRQKLRTLSFI